MDDAIMQTWQDAQGRARDAANRGIPMDARKQTWQDAKGHDAYSEWHWPNSSSPDMYDVASTIPGTGMLDDGGRSSFASTDESLADQLRESRGATKSGADSSGQRYQGNGGGLDGEALRLHRSNWHSEEVPKSSRPSSAGAACSTVRSAMQQPQRPSSGFSSGRGQSGRGAGLPQACGSTRGGGLDEGQACSSTQTRPKPATYHHAKMMPELVQAVPDRESGGPGCAAKRLPSRAEVGEHPSDLYESSGMVREELKMAYERIKALESELTESANDILNQRLATSAELEKRDRQLEERDGQLKERDKQLEERDRLLASFRFELRAANQSEARVAAELKAAREDTREGVTSKAAIALEKEAVSHRLRAKDAEIAAAQSLRRDMEARLEVQIKDAAARFEELGSKEMEARKRIDVLEATVRRYEAIACASSLPTQDCEAPADAELQRRSARRQSGEERLVLEAQVQELRRGAERYAAQVEQFEVENCRLREQRARLQEESDQSAQRLRLLDGLSHERKQLAEEVVALQRQLAEALFEVQERRETADVLAAKWAVRLDDQVFSELSPGDRNAWLAPALRRAAEAEQRMQVAQQDLATAREAAAGAKNDMALVNLKLSSRIQEGENLQVELVEARGRMESGLAELEKLRCDVEVAGAVAAAEMQRERLQLQEVLRQSLQKVQTEAAERIANLEVEVRKKDEQFQAFARLRSTIGQLQLVGGLSELSHVIAALGASDPSASTPPSTSDAGAAGGAGGSRAQVDASPKMGAPAA